MVSTVRAGLVRTGDIDFHQHNVRVDLGDLRDLVESIRRFGVMQPVALEPRGQRLRIRDGHRRVAAARLAGLTRIPAIVHAQALDEDEWLVAAVHVNTRRRGLDRADKLRTVAAMRQQGLSLDGVAEAFGVSASTVQRWLKDDAAAQGLPCTSSRLPGRSAAALQLAERLEQDDVAQPDTGVRLPARVVAERHGVSARTVTRHRTGRPVTAAALRTFADHARGNVEAGRWDAAALLQAVERLAQSGVVSVALDRAEAS